MARVQWHDGVMLLLLLLQKKSRTHVGASAMTKLAPDPSEDRGAVGDDVHADNIPRTIVARSHKVNPNVAELIRDVRKMMGPYTASNLRERNYNRMKDYASVATHLGISHILSFAQTKNKNIVLRIAKFHQGPTLHFRIPAYSLTKHVRTLQKRPYDSSAAFNTAPLVRTVEFSVFLFPSYVVWCLCRWC